MTSPTLGKTLIIANPASRSGRGADATRFVERFLSAYDSATDSFEVCRTRSSGDATIRATQARGYDSLIVLGGDGIIHETVCGLMRLDRELRPALGIIPMGSGNDFARSLGMVLNEPQTALSQIMSGEARPCDIGRVNVRDTGELTYFVETLSFGVDAAIALDTTARRAGGSRQEGASLFATSGVKLFSHAQKGWPYAASFDGGEPISGREIIFAVQNGPTYGGGFKIAPDAIVNDGLLDVCLNTRVPHVAHALALFAKARSGRHVESRVVRTLKARSIDVRFEGEVRPCQVDGEGLTGSHFAIDVMPAELRLIWPGRL